MSHPHTDRLEARHGSLDSQIASERARPRPDDTLIARLKKEKLALKQELGRPPA